MMQNLNFNDGYKEFTINNDSTRIVRFNPGDISILERFNEAKKKISEKQDTLKENIIIKPDGTPDVAEDQLDEAATLVSNLNQFIRDQTDYVFNSPVSDAVYGRQSPVSTVNGVTLFERFFTAAEELIEKEIDKEKAAGKKRMAKYVMESKKRK